MVMLMPERVIVTRPYLDSFGAGFLVTVSRALRAERKGSVVHTSSIFFRFRYKKIVQFCSRATCSS